MKPSKNAFIGYTYQECITLMLIAKMDVERIFENVKIEADVENNFDDAVISSSEGRKFFCQMKDIDKISVDDLTVQEDKIKIQNSWHRIAPDHNILFFKEIDLDCNSMFFDIPALQVDGIMIISLSRAQAIEHTLNLYGDDLVRENKIHSFFNRCLDQRKLTINRVDLPTIEIFRTSLIEETIDVGKKIMRVEDILFIEGKPGVGKSHLVTCLEKEYDNSITYRFWISNQDPNYQDRLKFKNFLTDTSRKLFRDRKHRSEDEILQEISNSPRVFIIDGLDHVENYFSDDLEKFIDFIEKLRNQCKVIVLSRPLRREIRWKKQQLTNWNFNETKKVLIDFYHISNHQIIRDIYKTTNGYPILVRFISEHFKKYSELPTQNILSDVNDYYQEIIKDTSMLSALTLFLCTRSFVMQNELRLFLEDELAIVAEEFIDTYPYLFERRLNRITLFHDSFKTFLRNKKLPFERRKEKVSDLVCKSLLKNETQFMSRFGYFSMSTNQKSKIVKHYTSIDLFQNILRSIIDYEALRSFYDQIRETLEDLSSSKLGLINYYDLSLIINILSREHMSPDNKFLYSYVRALILNDIPEEEITSSGFLFAMYYHVRTSDNSLLYNINSDSRFDTRNFSHKLYSDIKFEKEYFKLHSKPWTLDRSLKKFLKDDEVAPYRYIPHLLANLYFNDTSIEKLKRLQDAIRMYIDVSEFTGNVLMSNAIMSFKYISHYSAESHLAEAKEIVLSYGFKEVENEYLEKNLKQLILSNAEHGSFEVRPKVHNYLRYYCNLGQKFDITSISYLFAMYYNRKDYSVYSIDQALTVFEDHNLIDKSESIEIIHFTQSISEKGISHLMKSYIELNDPTIILDLIDVSDPDKYNITWFDLPSKYIDEFSDELFDYALYDQLLSRNQYSQKIDICDIETILDSQRIKEFVDIIKATEYKILLSKDHPKFDDLIVLECPLSIETQEREIRPTKDIEKRYNEGILDSHSIDFIKDKGLTLADVSKCVDGDYAVLGDLEIYSAFDEIEVRSNIQLILHNSVIGTRHLSEYYGNLFHYPGHVPRLLHDYRVDTDLQMFFNSFKRFLETSLLVSDQS